MLLCGLERTGDRASGAVRVFIAQCWKREDSCVNKEDRWGEVGQRQEEGASELPPQIPPRNNELKFEKFSGIMWGWFSLPWLVFGNSMPKNSQCGVGGNETA